MSIWNEFLYTIRLLKSNYAFSLLSTTVITFGLAASLILFSIAYTLLLRPLPFENGDRFVVATFGDPNAQVNFDFNTGFDAFRFQFLKDRATSYSTLGAMRTVRAVNLSDGDTPEVFVATDIESILLDATGVQPIMGRLLQASDDLIGSDPVVVISNDLWQGYYSGRADIIGYRSRVNSEPYTVVGVLPDDFSFPMVSDAWFPLRLPNLAQAGVGPADLTAVGILSDGVSLGEANREFSTINQALENQNSEEYEQHYDVSIKRYIQGMISGANYVMVATLTATILIIFLIIFNVSNLLTVRAYERVQELAIRNAVGASPTRIVATILLESFVVCFIGVFLGIILAAVGRELLILALEQSFVDNLPGYMNIGVDLNLIISALVMSLFVWLGSGVLPAIRVSRRDINGILADNSSGTTDKTGIRIAKIFVNLQVIVCCFLLIMTACLVQYLRSSQDVDFGIVEQDYVVGEVLLSATTYGSQSQKRRFYETLRAELISEQGINQVIITSNLPGTAQDPGSQLVPYVNYNLEDRDLKSTDNSYPSQYLVSVDENYFDFFGVELFAGRVFDATDTQDSLSVVVIDSRFSELLWPGESALGKRIQINPDANGDWLTVVGIVSPIRHDSAVTGPTSSSTTLFRPLSQSTPELLRVAAKLGNPMLDYRQSFKAATTRVDRDTPITNIMSFDELIANSTTFVLFASDLFTAVALIALFIAGCGIYGIVSRSVIRRTGEIGIRRALGADNRHAVNIFIKEGAWTLCLGLLVGGVPAILAVYGISSVLPLMLDYLFRAGPLVVAALIAIVLTASYLPARKLTRMEPGDALHHE